jgi:RND family efflux transporter MFP subunit
MAHAESERSLGALPGLKIDRKRRSARWHKPRIVALTILLVAALALVVWALRRPPMVSVVQVREARPAEDITELTAAGYVASERRSTVAPKIPGRLVSVLVKEGQSVDEGEVIAQLDDSDATVALRQAEAETRTAEAHVGVAAADLAKAERDLDQMSRLVATGAVSSKAYTDARSAEESARNTKRAADGELRAARDAAAAARIHLEDTVIRAPFSGTISKKLADEGAVLAPAAVSDVQVGGIVEIVDLASLNVEAELSEDRLSLVHEGQPALIFLDAYPDRTYQGKAGTIRPTIDKSKATAVVKVPFSEPTQGVFPNMGAKVSFLRRPADPAELEKEPRLRVPQSAIVKIAGGDAVFVVDQGRVKSEHVKLGPSFGSECSLVEGPAPGTQIVSAPRHLRDGQKVRVATGPT